jgi:uncharacterized OB-fold protein
VLSVPNYSDRVHPGAVYQILRDQDVFAANTCGPARYSPRPISPPCGSTYLEWTRSPGGRNAHG